MLQPEKEHLHPLHLVQSFSTLLSPEELLKISMSSIHPEKSSHDLWGVGPGIRIFKNKSKPNSLQAQIYCWLHSPKWFNKREHGLWIIYKYQIISNKEITISLIDCDCAINFPISAFNHSSTSLIYFALHRMVKHIMGSQIIKSYLSYLHCHCSYFHKNNSPYISF